MGKPSARSSWFPARSSISWSEILRRPFQLLAFLLLTGALLPLGGCGFRPLYGDHGATGGSTVNQLADVDVQSPETTVGRSLRYSLLDGMGTNGNAPVSPVYRLVLKPSSYTQDVAIQQDAAVTRANFVLVVPFTLVSTATNKTVFRSTARARSSYNRVESEFANLSAAQDAEKRVAEAVAEDIKLQVSVFFDRQASTGATAVP
jgi:LPS-assembly lipoprotein